ncbi:hypothetical protein [Ligilactobacillus faecis]|uniref:hypothetical protein n=1 Tax=Ligilactobacillus faecis TaxID=762833 RepID=UPI00246900B9|nr:hypothetical protein [Ligilactobacillus faecis]WGN89810.1 hypothetical protein QFX10_01680 [Ligilactobacillus faecis]
MKWSGYLVALLIGFGIGSFQTTWLMCWAFILAWVVGVVSDIIRPNEELQKKVKDFFFGDLGDL